MPKNTKAFAAAVIRRRDELGLTQQEVAAAGGPSDTTQRKIEAGDDVNVSAMSLRKIDEAFRWSPGTAARILGGGNQAPTGSATPSSTDATLRRARRSLAALAVTAGFIDDLRMGISFELEGGTPTADEWETVAMLYEEFSSEVGEFTDRLRRLAADVHGGDAALARAISDRAARFAEAGRRASTVTGRPLEAATYVVYGDDPDLPGDQDAALTREDQGERPDYELAARPGETEDEVRERLNIPYE